MLYAAKCYWPGATTGDLEKIAARAALCDARSLRDEVAYRGSLALFRDGLVLCLFEGPSRAAVKRASDRTGVPCERLIDAVWLDRDRPTRGTTR